MVQSILRVNLAKVPRSRCASRSFDMTRLLVVIPLFTVMLALSSCVTATKKSAAKTPAAPAAPPPVATAKPPAPPAPVSTPQTQVQLPPPQGLSPEALATIPPAPEGLPSPKSSTATKNGGQSKPPAASVQTPPAAKTEQPAQTAETPAPVQGPPTPPVIPPAEEQPTHLQPVYSEEERRRIAGDLERRKTEIEGILRNISQNRMSADQTGMVQRIRSFVTTAEDQVKRGDYRSAEALSERALILAKEMASGR